MKSQKPPAGRKSVKKWLRRLATIALVLVSLAFMVLQIARGLPEFSELSWTFSWPALAGSFVLLFVNFFLVAWGWEAVFRDLGERATIRQTFAIIYAAQLGRYIPGKIWIFLGQFHIAGQMGFRKSSALTAGIVQNLCGNIGAFIVFGFTVFGARYPSWMAWAAFGVAAAAAGFLLIAPAHLEGWINRWRARRGSDPVRFVVSRRTVLKVLGIMTLAWAEHCLAFALLVSAMTAVDLRTGFELGLAYNVAYHVAFYVLIVPGGLGVREGTITALLSSTIGAFMAGTIALVQRFWFLAGELLAFALSMAILRGQIKKP